MNLECRLKILFFVNYCTCDSSLFRPLSRSEKSLGLLTSKFVELLKSSPEGVLDLNVVSLFEDRIIIQ